MSFGQQRLWFGHALDPDAPHYALGRIYEIFGPLDIAALERALDAIVDRHESLRTTFHVEDGAFLQRVGAPLAGGWTRIDLRDRALADGWCDLDARLTRALHEAWDPRVGPILRGAIATLADGWHALLLTQRFIGADRWSRALLHRELSQLHDAFANGQPSPLAPLPLRYVDYSAWQRDRLSGARLDRLLDYWTGQLRDAPRSPQLPADRARASARARTGGTVYRRMPAAVVSRLGALAVQQRVTPFMLHVAAFNALLHRLTGDVDLVIGAPVAGRLRPETDAVIGFFGNTLALRTDASGDPAFVELLQRVRRTTLDAFAHQELPFERLVEALPVVREPFGDPLTRVLFAYQNQPDESLSLAGCEVRERDGVSAAFPFELALSLYPSDAGLLVRAQFQSALFDPGSIERLLARFETLLAGIADDPARPLSALPLMAPGEREQLLASMPGPVPPLPVPALVHRVFEQQVRRSPEALAVREAATQTDVSYAALNARAEAMATRLRQRGVTPGEVVALALARSADLIAAILAVLKCGGAYLPLERAPEARLRTVLDGSGVRLVLTDGSLLVPRVASVHTVDIREWAPAEDGVAAIARADPPATPEAQDDDLAYVMYTSGSTGTPKGVEVPHRAVVRLALASLAPMAPGDVVLHLAPVSFDASTFEIWTPLLTGATVALYPGAVFDLDLFEQTVRAERVTLLWLTASLFNTIVDLRPQALAGVRVLLAGGEALSVTHVRAALAQHPALRLFNGYGPTENTTFSLVHEVSRTLPADASSVPLGRPIAHTTAVVLDARGGLAPTGVPGELHVGGLGLARGYRGAPALTAERFVERALGPGETTRLYRTGDRVRRLADGTFEYLGRIDRQIKLRGFRIELDDIEAHLLSLSGVATAVAAVADDEGDRTLVAFAVPTAGTALSAPALRDALALQLPGYMVPAAVHVVDVLPTTSRGKIDRLALVEALATAPIETTNAGGTALQEAVSDVWAEVMGRPIGPHDNFFDAGGHSLLAVQVTARLRSAFDVALPLSALFEQPTVSGLAQVIADLRRSTPAGNAAPEGVHRRAPTTDAARDDAPVSFGQLRLWFLDQLDAESAAYNSTRTHLLRGRLNVDALQQACDDLLARHAALRTRFVFDGVEPQQVVEPVALVPFEVVDLRHLGPEEQRAASADRRARQSTRPFDLATAPMMRVLVLRLADDEHVLALCAHHIAIDGWSFGVIGRELGALYDARVSDRAPRLAPLAADYASYARWQRAHFTGDRRRQLLEYWRRQLGDLTPLPLGTGDRVAAAATAARRHRFVVAPALVAEVRALAGATHATLFMVLLAAFQGVLARRTGRADIAVAVPVANRSRPEFEGLVGFFVNTLVLRTSLTGSPTGRELVARVRRVALEAYDHQECPFEQVVDELRPSRTDGRTPLTSVLFALQTAPDGGLLLPGVTATRLINEQQRARFDLELTLHPAADGGLAGAVVHRLAALRDDEASAIAAAFERTLRELVASPDAVVVTTADDPLAGSSRVDGSAGVSAAPVGLGDTAPTRSAPTTDDDDTPGQTITEAMLSRVWSELLRLESVGLDDDFFELGGHSLLAVRLFARIEVERGRRFPVALLFQHGTIRRLARVLDDGRDDLWAPIVPLRRGGDDAPLFVVHGIGGEVLGFAALARALRPGRPVYAIQAPGPGAPADLPIEVQALCAHYVAAIRALAPTGPCLVAGYSAGGVFAIEIAKQLRLAGGEVPLVVVLDGGLPPGTRTASRTARHTAGTLLRQMAAWMRDVAWRVSPSDVPRWLGAKLRAQWWRLTRRWRRHGHQRVDIRDRFGTHAMPMEYQAWVEQRFAAFCRYPMTPYDGAMLVIRTRSGSLFGPPAEALSDDWRHFASGPCVVTTLACSHATLLESPHVDALGAVVQSALDRLPGQAPSARNRHR